MNVFITIKNICFYIRHSVLKDSPTCPFWHIGMAVSKMSQDMRIELAHPKKHSHRKNSCFFGKEVTSSL